MAKWPYNTTQWQELRTAKLQCNPLCEACALRGQVVSANTVDHTMPISAGGDAFPSLDKLMSLCAACHNYKTAAHDDPRMQHKKNKKRFKGCAVDGSPIDPSDAWYGGRQRLADSPLSDRPPPQTQS